MRSSSSAQVGVHTAGRRVISFERGESISSSMILKKTEKQRSAKKSWTQKAVSRLLSSMVGQSTDIQNQPMKRRCKNNNNWDSRNFFHIQFWISTAHLLYRKSNSNPGRATAVQMTKNITHPTASARYPVGAPVT